MPKEVAGGKEQRVAVWGESRSPWRALSEIQGAASEGQMRGGRSGGGGHRSTGGARPARSEA